MIPPGFVTGLLSEARLLKSLNAPVAVSGSNADTARERAEDLVRGGAAGLISFGLAGGLDPALRPGTLVVPSSVICNDAVFHCDSALLAALGGPTADRIASAGSVVADASAKAALFRATEAVAVDLESGPVAHVATAHGLPFAVLRAVADPADRHLPWIVSQAVTPSGGVMPGAIFRHLLAHPSSVLEFVTLARDAGAAQRTLRRRIRQLRMTGFEDRLRPAAFHR